MNLTQPLLNFSVGHDDGQMLWLGSLQVQHEWFGGQHLRGIAGASVLGQWQPQSGRRWLGFAQWAHIRLSGQPGREVDRFVLGGGYQHDWSPALQANLMAWQVKETPRLGGHEYAGHDGTAVRLGFSGTHAPWRWSANVQREHRRYGGPEPVFLLTRHERQRDLSFTVDYDLDSRWRAQARWAFTSARSRIAYYAYQRQAWLFSVRRDW